jgi:hypothetical protein
MSNVIGNRRDGKQVFYSLNGRVGVDDDGALDIGTHAFSVRISAPAAKFPPPQRVSAAAGISA